MYGHEYVEFEFRPEGRLRYANHSNYKRDSIIRKEVTLNPIVLSQLLEMIKASNILNADDKEWPQPDKNGAQELEIVIGEEHINFCTSKINSLMSLQESTTDVEGLRDFYYLVQDLKSLVFGLIGLQFKIKPI